jgi:hypothetical protein
MRVSSPRVLIETRAIKEGTLGERRRAPFKWGRVGACV